MNEVSKYLNSLNIGYNDNIVVAVSGGPDSMCLLNILIKFRNIRNFNIICAHVNHSKREQSKDEEEYVKAYCRENHVIFEYLKIDHYKDNINFHEQARNIRYNFFESLLNKYSSKYLFLAHHGDDLIETILMKITRGSNVLGYSGFKVLQIRENYNIVRPLIYVTKEDIYKYLKDNSIKYYIDDSNLKDVYTRNRYRKYVLPFLKEENKNIHKKYIKFSECLYEQEKFIEKFTRKKYMQLVVNDILKVDMFVKEEKLIQERIIYLMLSDIYKSNINLINQAHVRSIVKLVNNKKPNISINLPCSFSAVKEYNEFTIIKNKSNNNDYKYLLNDEIEVNNNIIKIVNKDNDTSNNIIRLDSKEISLPLYVRNRKNGDFIEVKGLNGTKKVKDILIDSKVPKHIRDNVPILVDNSGKILCVFGVKKSKYDKQYNDFYDIIVKCIKKKEEFYEQ